MKRFLVLVFLVACAPSLVAQVVLPESGRLAGPLEPTQSELGDEFFNFPDFMGMRPLPGQSPLAGWIEIAFGESYVDEDGFTKALFTLTYDSAGTTDSWAFENGQAYLLDQNRAVASPFVPNQGILNLDSGLVETISVNPVWANSTIAQVTRNNRIPLAFSSFFPVPPVPPEDLVGLGIPPGSFFADAWFTYDRQGKINGFQFLGLTVVPVAVLGSLNAQMGLFPPTAFGPNGEFYFANPFACLFPETQCPTEDDNPDGIELPLDAFFRPHFLLGSNELAEVGPRPKASPRCAPDGRGDVVVASVGHRLYLIGGMSSDGRVSNRVDVFDSEANSWSRGPSLPVAVTSAQGAVMGSRIYVYGGRQQARGPARSFLQVLDTATGRWTRGPRGPVPIALGVAEFAGDKLYVLTGRTNRPNGSPAGNLRFNSTALRFDPVNRFWITFRGGLEERGRSAEIIHLERATSATVGSSIFVLGGKTISNDVSDRALVLDGVIDRFAEGTRICFAPYDGVEPCQGTYDAEAVAVGNRIYLFGGRPQVDGPSTTSARVLTLGRDEWARLPEAPFPLAEGGATSIRGEIYLAGGRAQATTDRYPGAATAAFQSYDPGRGWAVCDSLPLFTADSLLNSASLAAAPRRLGPGSLAVLVGHNLGDEAAAPPMEPVPTELGGVEISVNGHAAPILSVGPNRVDFQIPYAVTTGAASIELARAGMRAPPPVTVAIADVAPGIFVDSFGETHNPIYLDRASAIACNADGTLNYAANAAPVGSVVTILAGGLGPVSPPLGNGERAPLGVTADLPVEVTIDGLEATVMAAQLFPGEVGVYGVTVLVPDGVREANRVPVEIEVSGAKSNTGALAIGTPTTPMPLPCAVPGGP